MFFIRNFLYKLSILASVSFLNLFNTSYILSFLSSNLFDPLSSSSLLSDIYGVLYGVLYGVYDVSNES